VDEPVRAPVPVPPPERKLALLKRWTKVPPGADGWAPTVLVVVPEQEPDSLREPRAGLPALLVRAQALPPAREPRARHYASSPNRPQRSRPRVQN
jgi:hypothetical protein